MLTLRNTAFQDESLYLFAGHDIWNSFLAGKQPSDSYASYFSGLPQFYPVLAAWLDGLGGLEAARALSSACDLWLTVALFLVGRNLFSRRVGLFASGVFAVQAPVLLIGRLATYDAFSLALLASGLALATLRARWWRSSLIVVLCCAAMAAKYAAAGFVPSVIVLSVLIIFRAHGLKAAIHQFMIAAATAVVLLLGLTWMIHYDPALLLGLDQTTTARVVLGHATHWQTLSEVSSILGPFACVAGAGLIFLIRSIVTRTLRIVAWILFASMLIAPAYHISKGEMVSLEKHMAFSMFFGALLIGWGMEAVLDSRFFTRTQSATVVLSLLLLMFGLASFTAHSMYSEWPNSSAMNSTLREVVRSNDTRVLAEEMEVPRYYLRNQTQGWQFTGLNYFDYTSLTGQIVQGNEAYKAALADGYFGVVVLRYGPSEDTAKSIKADLASDPDYVRIKSIPFSTTYGTGKYDVWRYEPSTPK